MSQLFLPSAPWLGWRPGVWGQQESVGLGRAKGSLEGASSGVEEEVGGEAGRLWQVAEEGKAARCPL